MNDSEIKNFYSQYHDPILISKVESPWRIRRYLHQIGYESVLKEIKSGEKVLEVGCGEGFLSVLMVKKGALVTATDISEKNLNSAEKFFSERGLKADFKLADAENLPFVDDYFDVVVADNVLEHLPDFQKGLKELGRVAKRQIVVLPTAFNLCAWCLLGGDVYWKITRRTPYAIFLGFVRFLKNWIAGKNGIDEGYKNIKSLPHVWRFPWEMKREIKSAGFEIEKIEAISLCLPYFNFLLPIVRFLDKFKAKIFWRNFGCGTLMVLKKSSFFGQPESKSEIQERD